MGSIINHFFINISIIFLLLSLTFYVMRSVLPIQPSSPAFVRFWFGVMGGLTAILLSINSFEFGAERIDLRLIPIALSAAYAGPFGVLVTLAMIFIARMTIEGMSAPFLDAMLMFVVLFAFSVLLARVGLHRRRAFITFIGFGALVVLIRATEKVGMATFVDVFVPYVVMLSLGAWLCYWTTRKLETHLWMFLLHTRRATIDELTGLANRYRTLERMNDLESSGQPWSLFVIDVDHFKQLNDTYGHRAGDEALRHIGQVLQDDCPSGGLIGRYGGEEFILVMEGHAGVARLADQLVQSIRLTPFTFGGDVIPLTVSIGVSVANQEPSMDVFERADCALYEAKREGRDRARIA